MKDEQPSPQSIAKVTWTDPSTDKAREHVLVEGSTAAIGRATTNDIVVLDRHVSRQHAVIAYRDGVFMLSDLGSINGTFVNDKQIDEPYPLFSGDTIRLYVPVLSFLAATSDDVRNAEATGTLIAPATKTGQGRLIITNGAQEGQTVPLLLDEITIGRATSNAKWEIGLQDPSVSRPHARIRRNGKEWLICDLGSSNGTRINDRFIDANIWQPLNDGDILGFGYSLTLFRSG